MAIALLESEQTLNTGGELSDDQLMVSFGRGDRSAFDMLYARYKQPLYGDLYRNCGNEASIDELFQDIWLKVVASSSRYKRQGKFRSWIFTMAHHCIVDFYRKSGRQAVGQVVEQSVVDEFASDQSTENIVQDREILLAVQAAIACLPLEQRQAFCLREESGFSVKEIAEIQDISVEAAKSRLRYAYGKLRERLADQSK
jgi:RNA polymerase sigma-70 factor (ECF subfamily)